MAIQNRISPPTCIPLFHLLITLLFVSGCVPPYAQGALIRLSEGVGTGNSAEFNHRLPELARDMTRIYIYRPQRFIGFGASPVVVINGEKFGHPGHPQQNLLLPGAVFVVDTDAEWSEVGLIQKVELTKPEREIPEDHLSIPSKPGQVWCLRMQLRATSTFLKIVDENIAASEIKGCRFSGYVRLVKPMQPN